RSDRRRRRHRRGDLQHPGHRPVPRRCHHAARLSCDPGREPRDRRHRRRLQPRRRRALRRPRPPHPLLMAAAWRFVRGKPLGAIGAFIILVLMVLALFADWIAADTYDQAVARMKPPGREFWMGTDNLGRDIWSRVVYGARISVTVGFATVALATLMATAVGVSSAYVGGGYDIAVQRVVDAWQSFPGLVIILSLMAVLGPGILNLVLALSILCAAGASRVIPGPPLPVIP